MHDLDEHIWGDAPGTSDSNGIGLLQGNLRTHVLLAACQKDESAKEMDNRGRFTSALLALLEKPDELKMLTYSNILNRIDRTLLIDQNPQVEGLNRDRKLFTCDVPRDFYPVSLQGNTYVTEAGTLDGVLLDSEFTVYESLDAFLDLRPLGTLVPVANRVTSRQSIMKPQGAQIPLPKPGIVVQRRAASGQALHIRTTFKVASLPEESQNVMQKMQRQNVIVLVQSTERAEVEVTLHDDRILFNILDRFARAVGLTRVYHDCPADTIPYNIFHAGSRFFWNLRRTHAHPLSRDVQIEFRALKVSTEENGIQVLEAVGDNLIDDHGVIRIPFSATTQYGIKLTNQSKWNLFPAVFYFNMADWSVTTYYHAGTSGPFTPDIPLRQNGGTLTIGYGSGGFDPFTYAAIDEKQMVGMGHLKIFLSTRPAELQDIAQRSPFLGVRESFRMPPPILNTWSSLQFPVVLRA
ncbi:hypothetical protein BDZ97DRAFT_1763657 [Flammula alnicola]|nr:hypothetical protein BDZ97DRAFT_1763657 [Flammula alnicola]